MKRRFLAVLLIVALAATVLGCGKDTTSAGSDPGPATAVSEAGTGNKAAASEPVELTLWTIATESDVFHQPYLDSIKDFEAAHPGVTIKMETFENEAYKTKIKSAVAANELPDVFFTWSGGFSESLVSSGKILPLDKYYDAYSDKISMAALSNDVYHGKLYGSVTCTPISALWYNKAMFAAQGLSVPTTWEEFKTVCQKFIDAGIKPIDTSVKDIWVLAMLHDALTLKSAGAEKVRKALKKEGQSYNDPDFLKSATCIKELVDMGAFIDGATSISGDEANAAFFSEQVPMYITGSWIAGDMSSAKKPENFSVAPIPVVNSANATMTDFMGGSSDTLMVAASTKYPDIAAAAAFEITKGVSKYAYFSGAGIPAWNVDYDASNIPALTQEVANLAANATSYTLWFDTLMTSDDAGEYITLLQLLFTGDLTPQEFVNSMDKQLRKHKEHSEEEIDLSD